MADNEETKETLVFFGGEVKALGDGRIGGYLVRFSGPDSPDLEGDYFDADTDFGELKRSPVYYQHGLDPRLKTRRLGVGEMSQDEIGLWIAAQLNLRDEYEKAIYELAEANKLGWSSGTASHLVERERKGEAWHITHWPLGLDASLTPTPAEPRNTAVPLKSLTAQPLKTEPAQAGPPTPKDPATPRVEDTNMPDAIPNPAENEELKSLGAQVQTQGERLDAFGASLDRILKAIETSPAAESAGYATNLGGTNDPEHKSMGDFLLSVRRNDVKRLHGIYKSTKDVSGASGNTGGYLIPHEYRPELMRIGLDDSGILSRVRRVPVSTKSGEYPALDSFAAPTAGSGATAAAGGITSTTTEEGGTYTETQPTFESVAWNVVKEGGYVEVTDEVMADSMIAIEGLLQDLFRITINGKLERNIIRGSGAGQPLGILNATCAIGVTTATNNAFAEADALAMLSRHTVASRQRSSVVWLMHPGVIPDFSAFTASGQDLVEWRQALPTGLLGYPIVFSEHMPQDDNDDVILADLGSYLLFVREDMRIAYSEHAGFTRGMGTWRFDARVDGQPWLRNVITLADPQGSYTVSPFVYHDD